MRKLWIVALVIGLFVVSPLSALAASCLGGGTAPMACCAKADAGRCCCETGKNDAPRTPPVAPTVSAPDAHLGPAAVVAVLPVVVVSAPIELAPSPAATSPAGPTARFHLTGTLLC